VIATYLDILEEQEKAEEEAMQEARHRG